MVVVVPRLLAHKSRDFVGGSLIKTVCRLKTLICQQCSPDPLMLHAAV